MSENVSQSRQNEAALALASGRTQTEAAAVVGVSGKTVWRWWQNPEFRRNVRNIRSRMLEEAVGVLVDASKESAEALARLAIEPHSYPSVRLNACKAILSFGSELHMDTELETRLQAIEERLGIGV